MEEVRDQSMVAWGMVFDVVVAKVDATEGPEKLEVALAGAILDPDEAHFSCFWSFLLDGVVLKSNGYGVINSHGSGSLGMSVLFDCHTDFKGILGG